MKPYDRLLETSKFLKSTCKVEPKLGFILGSGLSSFAKMIDVAQAWKFGEIPNFFPPSVEGHAGELLVGHLEGVPVAVLAGRLHAYEGHSFQNVVFPVRTMALLGVKTLVVTNASGGLNPKMKPGDFMIIKDHINLTGNNPLIGTNIAELGPRFVDMTDLYDTTLRKQLKKALTKYKVKHHEGIYGGLLGPTFETAAEIKYLQKIGCSAVGMSTVSEVIAARHAGLKIVGLACITNLGTGLSKHKLSHDDVKENATRVEKNFASVLKEFTRSVKSDLA
jgi:purine-nucleoside phosphorylase